jgi:hypothetical protein
MTRSATPTPTGTGTVTSTASPTATPHQSETLPQLQQRQRQEDAALRGQQGAEQQQLDALLTEERVTLENGQIEARADLVLQQRAARDAFIQTHPTASQLHAFDLQQQAERQELIAEERAERDLLNQRQLAAHQALDAQQHAEWQALQEQHRLERGQP